MGCILIILVYVFCVGGGIVLGAALGGFGMIAGAVLGFIVASSLVGGLNSR